MCPRRCRALLISSWIEVKDLSLPFGTPLIGDGLFSLAH